MPKSRKRRRKPVKTSGTSGSPLGKSPASRLQNPWASNAIKPRIPRG